MLGFAATDPDHPGNDYMLTAGHCALGYDMDIDDKAYHNYGIHAGDDIGTLRGAVQKLTAGVDAGYFHIWNADGNGATFSTAPSVVHGSGGTPYVLDVQSTVTDGQVPGSPRCHTGRGYPHDTITDCGDIQYSDFDGRIGQNTYILHQVLVLADGGRGDSGGPFYRRNTATNTVKAAGTHVGHMNPWYEESGTKSFYTKIGPALDEFDLNLKLANPLNECDPITSCPEDVTQGDYPE
jgi:V8-like Glu-specific endopeptidase